MSEIILFRFHKAYDVCVQTLTLLRRLNPGVPIHGLYGGNDPVEKLPSGLTGLMDSTWKLPLDDPSYKWKNGDLCARWWFRDYGRNLAFDHAYFLEWDQLFVKPLLDVYGPLEKEANYGTIFGDFKYVSETKWYWMHQQYGHETDKLVEHLEKIGLPVDMTTLYFSIMDGAVFCRTFLERYIADPVPCYSNDEVRLSFYSAAFGIALRDNHIWRDMKLGKNIYNAENEELTEKDLNTVIKNGGNVLHPLRILIENLNERIK